MFKTPKSCLQIVTLCLLLLAGWAQADTLQDVLKSGKLRVGVSLFVPWTMQDKDGKLSGFEIDVAEKIAQDMGVQPEYKIYKWENIINGLENNEIDIIVAGMAITPARALRINFSRPYAESGVAIVTNTKMTRNIKKLKAMNDADIVFATVTDTIAHDLAKRLFNNAQINAFQTAAEAEKAVLEGKAYAYIASTTEARFLALQHPKTVDLPLQKPLLMSKAGLAVNKGEQDWLNFLNAWVTAREADKWLSATHKYWFGSLDWQEQVQQ